MNYLLVFFPYLVLLICDVKVMMNLKICYRFFRQLLAFFSVHQMALSLFRFIAAVGRTQVVAGTLGTFTLLIVFVLGGFIVSKGMQRFFTLLTTIRWLFI